MKIYSLITMALLAIQSASAAPAEDKIYLDETVISGNQELPRVLYILPWREHSANPVAVKAPALVTKNTIRTVNRTEFRRQLNVYKQYQNQKIQTQPEED